MSKTLPAEQSWEDWEANRSAREKARKEVLAAITKRPRCRFCNRELRPYLHFDPTHGEKPAFGDYGDWVFCGLRCGYNFAVDSLGASPRHRP